MTVAATRANMASEAVSGHLSTDASRLALRGGCNHFRRGSRRARSDHVFVEGHASRALTRVTVSRGGWARRSWSSSLRGGGSPASYPLQGPRVGILALGPSTRSSPEALPQTLAKAHRQLTELQARLARGKTRKARDKVEAEIAGILGPRWVSQVITWSLTGESGAELRLRFSSDEKARAALEEELFGKRILCTDKTRKAASTATIVTEYRAQEAVEGDFRQMKDTTVVSNSAMFHWTESKIRVHVFYCVLGLTVARLMVREADRAGIQMSVRELLSTLAGIEETVLVYQGERGRPRARRMLTDIEPPLSVSTTSSVSMPMPPRAELGNTASPSKCSRTGRCHARPRSPGSTTRGPTATCSPYSPPQGVPGRPGPLEMAGQLLRPCSDTVVGWGSQMGVGRVADLPDASRCRKNTVHGTRTPLTAWSGRPGR